MEREHLIENQNEKKEESSEVCAPEEDRRLLHHLLFPLGCVCPGGGRRGEAGGRDWALGCWWEEEWERAMPESEKDHE